MSQFNLYLERVQENRNYYYESSAEEYEEKGYKLGKDSKWRNPQGLVLKDPKYETKKQGNDALYNDPIRKALREPAEKAEWDGTIPLSQKDKETLHNIFIKTPIAALISLGLLLSQVLPLEEVKLNNIEFDALQEIYSSNQNVVDKRQAVELVKSVMEKAKKGEKIDINELKKIVPKASKELEQIKSNPNFFQKIKNLF